jgi:hypothetical protein
VELPCLPRVGDVVVITGQLGWGERKPPEKSIAGAAYDYTPEKGDYGMYKDHTPGTGTCVVRSVNWLIKREVPQEMDWGTSPLLVTPRPDGAEPNHPGVIPVINPGSEPKLTKISVEVEMVDGPYNSEGFKAALERYRQRGKTIREVE